MAAVAAAEIKGVATIRAELARRLRSTPARICAKDLLGYSGEFLAGDRLYVTTRGRDGGQSALGIGLALVDAASLEECAGDAVVIDALELLWRGAPQGEDG